MSERPERNVYYMKIAEAVRLRADCLGRKVGAILVRNDRVISTGYNGTPAGMKNCTEGGCYRCSNREGYASGTGYDVCICVHAEQNAILSAARCGNALVDCTLYSTLRPCFSCLKEALQAGIHDVYFLEDVHYGSDALQAQYHELERQFRTIAPVQCNS